MLTREAPNSFQKILSVKPGLTSIGQLHFGYASTAQENVQRMRYDLIYLEKLSFKLDVLLIAQTLRLMFQGKGQ
jgi:lipopolysaccharide/colanic/teichoic acid biosynthesis glycosyltransferase